MDRDRELDVFKREINLVQFATSRGYELRRRESSRLSKVLAHPGTGDKIVVARDATDEHWVYFSVRDARDNGSVVDFVQNRSHSSLGNARRELRAWLGSPAMPLPRDEAHVQPSSPDRARVTATYDRAEPAANSEYLNSRGVRSETLSDPRFAGAWRIDDRGNVIFPHRDRDGLTGYEVKNEGFTGFAAGGVKSVWHSAARKSDDRLVIVESAIDALSYHQLHPHERSRYVSTGGEPSREQQLLLARAVAKMAVGSEVVAGTDNDASGHRLAGAIDAMVKQHEHLRFRRHAPAEHKDWNDVLRANELAYIRTVMLARSYGRTKTENER